MPDLLNRATALVTTHIEPVRDSTAVSDARSRVFRVTGESGRAYAVKLYPAGGGGDASHPGALEAVAYRRLAGAPGVRHCHAGGDDFLITEYASGTVLMDAMRTGALDHAAVAGQLVSYLRACAAVPVLGFGAPDDTLCGPGTSWPAYLDGYLDRIGTRLAALPADRAGPLESSRHALRAYLATAVSELDTVRPAFVPIDLNLTNLLVTDEGQLVVLDLKTFWLGDPLLALGEWLAHSYGTPMHGSVLAAWQHDQPGGTALPARRVRFYALLATLDIQVFIAEAGGDPELTAPWGNDVPFGDLAAAHRRALTEPAPLPEDLLRTVPELGAGWSGKPAGGHREDPGQLLARLTRVQALAGITRVADITGLDRTGIHVAQSVRPAAETSADTFTVFSGRGATAQLSKLAAIAEGIERFCGERGQFATDRMLTATTREIADRHQIIGPEQFNLPADADYQPDSVLEWVPATDIGTGERWHVPACAVFYPYAAPPGVTAPLRYFTTGFGAGTSLVRALAHGLAEVAERDAAALNRILRANPAVPLDSIQAPVPRSRLDQLLAAGLDVIVRSITAPDVGIPVFSASCEDAYSQRQLYLSGGYGAHPDKDVALVRAVEEAAASRAGTISGAREDLAKFERPGTEDYAEFRRRYAYWFDLSSTVDYATLPGTRWPTALDDLAALARAFAGAGFPRILYVDLSRAEFNTAEPNGSNTDELGLRVVKVLVPGVERYSFRMRCVGVRARRMYRERYGHDLRLPPIHNGFTGRVRGFR